jgi:tungstate transport system ATP-binding protein
LDPGSVLIIERLIQQASAAGVKVIFVSHDIGQAKRLASDVVFLHQGKITEHSPAETFFKQPISKEAQAYLAGELLV